MNVDVDKVFEELVQEAYNDSVLDDDEEEREETNVK